MNCKKSYLWSWEVGWVSFACKWAYGSIWNAYVKWNVEHSMRLIIELLWVFLAKIRSLKGETNVYEVY